MVQINKNIAIYDDEFKMEFIRSSGPGGQNVNKVATAVQLRFDIRNSLSLPEDVKNRLLNLPDKRLTKEGVLIIEAKRFRTQEKNRSDAIQRLKELIRKAAEKPKVRKRTKPPKVAKQKRLEEKRKRAEIKKLRKLYE